MNHEHRLPLETRLTNFRDWARQHHFTRCRLVHYCCFEYVNAADVPLDEVEGNIRGCLGEGLGVDWSQKDECLFLVVLDGWELPLDWNQVYEERDFDDSDWISPFL